MYTTVKKSQWPKNPTVKKSPRSKKSPQVPKIPPGPKIPFYFLCMFVFKVFDGKESFLPMPTRVLITIRHTSPFAFWQDSPISVIPVHSGAAECNPLLPKQVVSQLWDHWYAPMFGDRSSTQSEMIKSSNSSISAGVRLNWRISLKNATCSRVTLKKKNVHTKKR